MVAVDFANLELQTIPKFGLPLLSLAGPEPDAPSQAPFLHLSVSQGFVYLTCGAAIW